MTLNREGRHDDVNHMNQLGRVHVSIVQPAIPAGIRAPVFRRLADDPRIGLRCYSAASGEVAEVSDEGFRCQVFRQITIGSAFTWWHIEVANRS